MCTCGRHKKKKMAKSSKIILPTLQKHYHDYVVFLSTTEAKMCSSPGYNARKDETFSGAFFFRKVAKWKATKRNMHHGIKENIAVY